MTTTANPALADKQPAAPAAPAPTMNHGGRYALALIAIAATSAGSTWGFGRIWRSLPIVRSNSWLV